MLRQRIQYRGWLYWFLLVWIVGETGYRAFKLSQAFAILMEFDAGLVWQAMSWAHKQVVYNAVVSILLGIAMSVLLGLRRRVTAMLLLPGIALGLWANYANYHRLQFDGTLQSAWGAYWGGLIGGWIGFLIFAGALMYVCSEEYGERPATTGERTQ